MNVPSGSLKLYAARSCSILCKTYHNTNFSNSKSTCEKNYFERVCLWYYPYQQGITCSKLATETQEQGVFIVNCKDISVFALIVEFEQANVCWVHIEKSNTFEDMIGYIMRYVLVFSVRTKFIEKWHLNLNHHNPTGESVRNFSRVYFRRWSCLKRCDLLYTCLFTDFAHWKTN